MPFAYSMKKCMVCPKFLAVFQYLLSIVLNLLFLFTGCFVGIIKSNEIFTAIQTLGFDTRHEKLYGLISNHTATEEYITFKEFLDLISKGVVRKI